MGYEYTNANLKGKKRKLLKENEFSNLVRASDLPEIKDILSDTNYSKYLRDRTKFKEFDGALNRYLIDVEYKLSEMVPEEIAEVFRAYMQRWDYKNYKRAITLILKDKEIKKDKLIDAPTGDSIERIEEWTNVESERELKKGFSGTKFDLLSKILEESESREDAIFKGRLAFEKLFQEKILEAIEGKPEPVRQFFGTRIDFRNIKVIIRLKEEDLDRSEILDLLLPTYQIQEQKIKEMINKENREDILRELDHSFYESLVKAEDLDAMDLIFEKSLKKYAKRLFLRDVLGPGVVIAYYCLKSLEVSNLKKILAGKTADWSVEEISNFIVT
ncbi:MAG: Archaeal/vacuolar-type H+-ATPase subunit C [Candidatus Methanohalarchaeum thermophilum]|uniref:Archaeal/vacuolar-type H+-ATPase subunit C n=1 Tax=Methanohalarchaeum thermophilum TaxID=1903181 RepID=A0A1Q6DUU0_METT1|nr:MAG: Archaeal/vacuolar-type H+-ATPase subunit C [Candidatus Methanohalarchaeum thermophilum]